MAKKTSPKSTAKTSTAKSKRPTSKPAPAKAAPPVEHLHDDHCEHDEPDTFVAIMDVSPALVVLFDAVIASSGGSHNVTLGDMRKILEGMNKAMKRLATISPKTTLQQIEYLEKLPK